MPLSDTFPIARLFPPKNPDVIQLYSFPTPNGVKISIALEETGLAYEPHRIDIKNNVQKTRNSSRSIPMARFRPSLIRTAPAASRSACSNPAPSCPGLRRRPAR